MIDHPPKSVVKITPEQQLRTGWLHFQMGESYRNVAISAAGEYMDPVHAFNKAEEWLAIHDPVCNLFGHATELYLKAFLVAKETPRDLTRGTYGHKLNNLYIEAKGYGLAISQDSVDTINGLNAFYGFSPYRLRYPQIGKRSLMFPYNLDEACNDLRKMAFPAVNRKARSEGIVVKDNPPEDTI